jgi:hypothetical protein
MILQVKRTRYASVDRRSTVHAEEINLGSLDPWPTGIEVENLDGSKKLFLNTYSNELAAEYESIDSERIVVLR